MQANRKSPRHPNSCGPRCRLATARRQWRWLISTLRVKEFPRIATKRECYCWLRLKSGTLKQSRGCKSWTKPAVRCTPRSTAAPLGPAMRHCVCFMARRICWRSASSRVEIEDAVEVEEVKEVKDAKDEERSVPAAALDMAVDFNSATGTRSSLPGERRTARSRRFSSSRTLPGKE